MKALKSFIKKHAIAIIFACIAGVISIAPQVAFIFSPNSGYQGIPILATANEDAYLTRMKEIIDGHPKTGSAWLYEYKNTPPLLPPVSEMIWVGMGSAMFLSVVNTVVVMKFFLPMVLFFLVYLLIHRLIGEEGMLSKMTSIAGAAFVTLGYDLVDYKTAIDVFFGRRMLSGFLVWTRPVNPINGAILLFSFLLVLWSLIKNASRKKIIAAAVIFLLAVVTYFFTWAIALSIACVLILLHLLRKKYTVAKSLAAIVLLGALLGIPYFIIVMSASRHPWYEDSSARIGLIYGREMIFNKMILASFAVFAIMSIILYRKHGWKKIQESEWWWFSLALLLASVWVFSQQAFTGVSVWPPHFVQYTIPISVVAVMVVLHKTLNRAPSFIMKGVMVVIISASVFYGAYGQNMGYVVNFDSFQKLQGAMDVYDWLNENTKKDSVVLSVTEDHRVNDYVTVYTENNVYFTRNIVSLIPTERLAHNYMVQLRFMEIAPQELDEYLNANTIGYRAHFGGIEDFKEIRATEIFEKNKNIVPDRYPEFYENNFLDELQRYRLDYVVADRDLRETEDLEGLVFLKRINAYYIYGFQGVKGEGTE